MFHRSQEGKARFLGRDYLSDQRVIAHENQSSLCANLQCQKGKMSQNSQQEAHVSSQCDSINNFIQQNSRTHLKLVLTALLSAPRWTLHPQPLRPNLLIPIPQPELPGKVNLVKDRSASEGST